MIEKGILYSIDYIDEIEHIFNQSEQIKTGRGDNAKYYYNIPSSYDIETSSFKIGDEKIAINYSHCINIDGYLFHCRTWEEMEKVTRDIVYYGQLNLENRLIVYVHNLSYEFQWIKKHFDFAHIFANGDKRKILYAITKDGIEFRCSMMLAGGYGLAKVAENLLTYKISKLKGDLDYELIRTPETPLKPKELGYIKNDVVIIEYFIRECMDKDGDITKIPLTNTGYVRNYCRNHTIKQENKKRAKNYKDLINSLTLEKDEYLACRKAFAGGYTHASAENVFKVFENVKSQDFTSSYMGVMMSYKYPMSKGEIYYPSGPDDFFQKLDEYCCIFYIKMYGVGCKTNEGYISHSKCDESAGVIRNNGRVDVADMVGLWMTDVDFKCVQMSYDIADFEIGQMYLYKPGYLPKDLLDCVFKFYADKTMLKGVHGREAEYTHSKGMLLSTYGMMVTDIIQDDNIWDDLHKCMDTATADVEEKIEKENKSHKRFLFYPWGVFVTAYARYNLFSMMVKLGNDYIYGDTDSLKYTNYAQYEHLFKDDSNRILDLLHKMCDHYGYDRALLSPQDIKGKSHTIGLWDDEGVYTRFKTLGAKRYMTETIIKKKRKNRNPKFIKQISLTVSGVNKKSTMPYLLKTYGHNVFDNFDDGLHIPEDYSGKMTHNYIDEAKEGDITDYLGNDYHFMELSSVHLEKSSYDLTIAEEYKGFVDKIRAV